MDVYMQTESHEHTLGLTFQCQWRAGLRTTMVATETTLTLLLQGSILMFLLSACFLSETAYLNVARMSVDVLL